MNLPAISIIIPTLNRLELLQQTLDSVRKQTFKDWEVLLVDDGSNDEMIESLLQMSRQDSRIRYLQRQRQKSGASACRNEGTEASQAKYIIYLDSDDCLSPQALSNRFSEMERHPELDWGIFPCVLFRQQPGDINLLWNIDTSVNDIDRFLALDPPWQTTSPIWRRSSLGKIGLWDENVLSWQDWEFHLRAAIANLKYRRFNQPDCFWRMPQKDTIGLKSQSPEHLKSHEQLLPRIYQLLVEAGSLTKERQILFGGLYLWLAETWLYQRENLEALRVWKVCYEKGIISEPFYSQGVRYLKILAIWYGAISDVSASQRFARRVMRRATRIYFEAIWPPGLMPKSSKTFRKIPLAASDRFLSSSLLSRTGE